MQITAKIIQLLPLQTGTGKNGEWKKQDVIFETDGTYPKKICVSFWGDKIDEKKLQPGNVLKIDFDAESREYNGKWYTDLKAWKVEVEGGSGSGTAEAKPSVKVETVKPISLPNESLDDLPF